VVDERDATFGRGLMDAVSLMLPAPESIGSSCRLCSVARFPQSEASDAELIPLYEYKRGSACADHRSVRVGPAL
jgi:hypothetical protein